MGAIDGPAVLAPADIAEAMELSAQAGWNQLPADWNLFMVHGKVFGLFDGKVLVATAAIMPYGDDFAWISMVLTRKDWRGRGFGTALLKTCIAELEAMGRTALLDATPAGEPLYRSLGFEDGERFTRWQGMGGGVLAAAPAAADPAALAAANAAFGADRTPLLADFSARCPAARRSAPQGAVHAFGRNGRIATQIGPVIGADEAAVSDLVANIVAVLDGPVFLDVSDRYPRLVERLRALGFARQRPFLRMKKGRAPAPTRAGETAVIAGPEFG